MAANFLHGIETIEIDQGPRPITEVRTAVIGLVGIAPTGPAQQCVLVTNDVQAAQFGKQIPGFNIPQSLDHIFAQGFLFLLYYQCYQWMDFYHKK